MFVVKHKLSSTQEYCVFTRDFKQLSSRVFFALTDKLFNRSVTFREIHFNFSPVLFSTSLLNYARRGRRGTFSTFARSPIILTIHIYTYIYICVMRIARQWSMVTNPVIRHFFDDLSDITSLAIITILHIKIQPCK